MKKVSVYDIIKKQNGEHFARTIRNYNNGIFEIPDIVNIVKYAGRDAEPIINYLLSLMNIEVEETEYVDPFVLLKKAGYNAYYADTLKKQNAISKYFAKNEKLCTFKDKNRFKNCYIINAVKENVDDIKRKDFKNPKREDEYGTSVISIQILKVKDSGFISIKNRYNHTVENPDNTFGSNPDNIIKGLTYSLEKYFYVKFTYKQGNLTDNHIFINNKIIKFNCEKNGYYVGDGYYVKNGKITEINKQTEVMMDWYILNLKNKTVTTIIQDETSVKYTEEDYKNTAKIFTNEIKDKAIQIVKNEDKTKSILLDGKEFINLNNSQITKLNLERATEIGDYFLFENEELKELNLSNVKKIGTQFLFHNKELEKLNLPKVEKIGDYFLYLNKELKAIDLPAVKYIGESFLAENKKITSINLPNVLYIDDNFLSHNTVLESLNLPAVEKIGPYFLDYNNVLKELNVPNLKQWTNHLPNLIRNLIKKSLEKKEKANILEQTKSNSR